MTASSGQPAADRVEKRSVAIRGHRTSVSLEAPFWQALKEMAAAEGRSLGSLIAGVDAASTGNLSSALRLHVLAWLQSRLAAREGPARGPAPAAADQSSTPGQRRSAARI